MSGIQLMEGAPRKVIDPNAPQPRGDAAKAYEGAVLFDLQRES